MNKLLMAGAAAVLVFATHPLLADDATTTAPAAAPAAPEADADPVVATVNGTPLHHSDVVASARGLPFHGVWLEAAPEILRARVAGRTGDASDATLATLEDQLARDPGSMTWRRLDASTLVDALARAWIADRTP